jgi:hypothetical protein
MASVLVCVLIVVAYEVGERAVLYDIGVARCKILPDLCREHFCSASLDLMRVLPRRLATR